MQYASLAWGDVHPFLLTIQTVKNAVLLQVQYERMIASY